MDFCYDNKDRDAIVAAAPRPLTDTDFRELERLAAVCPGVAITAKKARQIERKCASLALLLEQLSPAQRSLEISRLMQALQTLRLELRSAPKHKLKKSNRARPQVIDEFLLSFVQFYVSRGGYPGTAPTSPCVSFVISAAGPALAAAGWEIKPGTCSNLIRSRFRRLGAVTLKVSAPEIGTPAFGQVHNLVPAPFDLSGPEIGKPVLGSRRPDEGCN